MIMNLFQPRQRSYSPEEFTHSLEIPTDELFSKAIKSLEMISARAEEKGDVIIYSIKTDIGEGVLRTVKGSRRIWWTEGTDSDIIDTLKYVYKGAKE